MCISSVLQTIIATAKIQSPLRIVSGNQSGDLDSIISAISFSYFQYIQSKDCILPFLNFKRLELETRKDVLLLFKRHGINSNYLIFTDDLLDLKIDEVILVDHNYPQGELKTYIQQKRSKIVGIIDHHDDEGDFKNVKPRIIEKCGSCSSLIFNYWNTKNVELNKEIVELIIAPLIIDTSNLSSKVERADITAFQKYKDYLSLNPTLFFEELKKAKDDISSLTTIQILSKDYKLFEFIVSTSNTVKNIGISSVVKPFNWLLEKSPSLVQEVQEFLIINDLNLFIIMTAFKDSNDNFKREIIFFSKNDDDDDDDGLRHLLTKELLDELNLHLLYNESTFEQYDQLDISKSRKQVAPSIKRILELK